MSGTIPLPTVSNPGNTENPNRVETVFEPDTANNNGTKNIINNVVGEDDLPNFDFRGDSHVINVPQLDVGDFTSWKDRFLVYLDGLEPFLLGILENGPFVPKSIASTPKNFLPKPQKQWTADDRKLANQDKRLKSIIILCIPNDTMKVDSDSYVEEGTGSNSEFLADLNAEFHDRALLANQKRMNNIYPFEDEGVTRVKAFIAIAEDELTVGKTDARLYKCRHPLCGKSEEKLDQKLSNDEDDVISNLVGLHMYMLLWWMEMERSLRLALVDDVFRKL
nr:hypothetical protein [Tanacetum cinerariifolium]